MKPPSPLPRLAARVAVALGVVILALGIFLWARGLREVGIVVVCFGVLDTAFWLRRALAAPKDAA